MGPFIGDFLRRPSLFDSTMRASSIIAIAAACASAGLLPPASGSNCYGNPAHGGIEHAVPLPAKGSNFGPYTELGIRLGRTFVHATVRDILVDAYRDLEGIQPGVMYIYGESGLRNGGRMPPHRTHQAGVSVDFMVPVRDLEGRPATLPRSAANRFGYDLEFDSEGRWNTLQIDFDAIADHLHRLNRRARERGAGIARVIFDPALTRKLRRSAAGSQISSLPFMKTTPWIRHDEHYHVDFAIECAPERVSLGGR